MYLGSDRTEEYMISPGTDNPVGFNPLELRNETRHSHCCVFSLPFLLFWSEYKHHDLESSSLHGWKFKWRYGWRGSLEMWENMSFWIFFKGLRVCVHMCMCVKCSKKGQLSYCLCWGHILLFRKILMFLREKRPIYNRENDKSMVSFSCLSNSSNLLEQLVFQWPYIIRGFIYVVAHVKPMGSSSVTFGCPKKNLYCSSVSMNIDIWLTSLQHFFRSSALKQIPQRK